MNQQELEKHVKANLTIQIILYIVCGLTLVVSIFAIAITPAKAQTQTADLNSSIYTHCGTGTSYNKYCDYNPNVIQVETARSLNTTYNGVTYQISFGFQRNMSAFSQYILNVYAMSTDFRNNNLYVNVYGSSSESSIGTMMLNTSYSMISKNQIQVIIPQNSYSYHYVEIVGEPLTGINTYGIKKITLTWDDGTTDVSGVIENQTQNTQDIINSSNSNTQDIINNQNNNTEQTNQTIWDSTNSIISQLANKCNNLIDLSKVTADSGATLSNISNQYGTISVTAPNNKGFWTDYIPIDYSLKYYFNATLSSYSGNNGYIYYVYYYDSNKVELSNYRIYGGQICQNQSACNPIQSKYIRIHVFNYLDGTRNFSNIRLNVNNGAWCGFNAITGNKIDGLITGIAGVETALEENKTKLEDLEDIQQDTYDYLTDNSNPSVDSNGIQSTINSVQTSNPLAYLLTLPTNLLSSIITGLQSNSCTDFQIGSFGTIGRHDLSGYTFKFPCINLEQKIGSSLWNTIDIFVSVGILVITISKLYSTISSYITLGAEDEAKAHSHFLTPMDFLGNILGGNISGVGNSLYDNGGGS